MFSTQDLPTSTKALSFGDKVAITETHNGAGPLLFEQVMLWLSRPISIIAELRNMGIDDLGKRRSLTVSG
jgi:hypothetical protein